MALRWLLFQEMAVLSGPWVTDGTPARMAIGKYQQLDSLVPQLQEAHGEIVELRSKESPQLQALSQQELQVDAKHDAYVKLIYNALTVLAPGSASGNELLSLRDMLFPEKLQHMKKSYRGEVGHAVLVAKQMDEATQARLKAVQLHDKTLFDLYSEWQRTAKQLGDLEDERAHLSQATPSPAKEIASARNRWIRVVKAFQACAEVANLDAETDNLIFAPLRAAEQVADNRMRSKAAPEPGPAPAPASTTSAEKPKAS
jgi:hypothetical protein